MMGIHLREAKKQTRGGQKMVCLLDPTRDTTLIPEEWRMSTNDGRLQLREREERRGGETAETID